MYLGHRGYWYPQFQVDQIKPSLELDKVIHGANNRDSYLLVRAVKLNWLVNHLKTHSMVKPLLLNDNFSTIQGDTRVMALKLLGIESASTVVFKFRADQSDILISSQKHFIELASLDTDTQIISEPVDCDPFKGYKIEALHIINKNCNLHFEDWDLRNGAITNYLEEFPNTVFDQDWFLSPIDWAQYQ